MERSIRKIEIYVNESFASVGDVVGKIVKKCSFQRKSSSMFRTSVINSRTYSKEVRFLFIKLVIWLHDEHRVSFIFRQSLELCFQLVERPVIAQLFVDGRVTRQRIDVVVVVIVNIVIVRVVRDGFGERRRR